MSVALDLEIFVRVSLFIAMFDSACPFDRFTPF